MRKRKINEFRGIILVNHQKILTPQENKYTSDIAAYPTASFQSLNDNNFLAQIEHIEELVLHPTTSEDELVLVAFLQTDFWFQHLTKIVLILSDTNNYFANIGNISIRTPVLQSIELKGYIYFSPPKSFPIFISQFYTVKNLIFSDNISNHLIFSWVATSFPEITSLTIYNTKLYLPLTADSTLPPKLKELSLFSIMVVNHSHRSIEILNQGSELQSLTLSHTLFEEKSYSNLRNANIRELTITLNENDCSEAGQKVVLLENFKQFLLADGLIKSFPQLITLRLQLSQHSFIVSEKNSLLEALALAVAKSELQKITLLTLFSNSRPQNNSSVISLVNFSLSDWVKTLNKLLKERDNHSIKVTAEYQGFSNYHLHTIAQVFRIKRDRQLKNIDFIFPMVIGFLVSSPLSNKAFSTYLIGMELLYSRVHTTLASNRQPNIIALNKEIIKALQAENKEKKRLILRQVGLSEIIQRLHLMIASGDYLTAIALITQCQTSSNQEHPPITHILDCRKTINLLERLTEFLSQPVKQTVSTWVGLVQACQAMRKYLLPQTKENDAIAISIYFAVLQNRDILKETLLFDWNDWIDHSFKLIPSHYFKMYGFRHAALNFFRYISLKAAEFCNKRAPDTMRTVLLKLTEILPIDCEEKRSILFLLVKQDKIINLQPDDTKDPDLSHVSLNRCQWISTLIRVCHETGVRNGLNTFGEVYDQKCKHYWQIIKTIYEAVPHDKQLILEESKKALISVIKHEYRAIIDIRRIRIYLLSLKNEGTHINRSWKQFMKNIKSDHEFDFDHEIFNFLYEIFIRKNPTLGRKSIPQLTKTNLPKICDRLSKTLAVPISGDFIPHNAESKNMHRNASIHWQDFINFFIMRLLAAWGESRAEVIKYAKKIISFVSHSSDFSLLPEDLQQQIEFLQTYADFDKMSTESKFISKISGTLSNVQILFSPHFNNSNFFYSLNRLSEGQDHIIFVKFYMTNDWKVYKKISFNKKPVWYEASPTSIFAERLAKIGINNALPQDQCDLRLLLLDHKLSFQQIQLAEIMDFSYAQDEQAINEFLTRWNHLHDCHYILFLYSPAIKGWKAYRKKSSSRNREIKRIQHEIIPGKPFSDRLAKINLKNITEADITDIEQLLKDHTLFVKRKTMTKNLDSKISHPLPASSGLLSSNSIIWSPLFLRPSASSSSSSSSSSSGSTPVSFSTLPTLFRSNNSNPTSLNLLSSMPLPFSTHSSTSSSDSILDLPCLRSSASSSSSSSAFVNLPSSMPFSFPISSSSSSSSDSILAPPFLRSSASSTGNSSSSSSSSSSNSRNNDNGSNVPMEIDTEETPPSLGSSSSAPASYFSTSSILFSSNNRNSEIPIPPRSNSTKQPLI